MSVFPLIRRGCYHKGSIKECNWTVWPTNIKNNSTVGWTVRIIRLFRWNTAHVPACCTTSTLSPVLYLYFGSIVTFCNTLSTKIMCVHIKSKELDFTACMVSLNFICTFCLLYSGVAAFLLLLYNFKSKIYPVTKTFITKKFWSISLSPKM